MKQMADFITSALAEHAWNSNYWVDWDSVSVLRKSEDTVSQII